MRGNHLCKMSIISGIQIIQNVFFFSFKKHFNKALYCEIIQLKILFDISTLLHFTMDCFTHLSGFPYPFHLE